MWRVCAAWTVWRLCAACAGSLLPLDAERLRAGVGGFALMNCHLDFPFGNEIPYHLQWDKDGETIFSWYSGDAAPAVGARWAGRLRLADPAPALGRAALNVTAVRETDAGLYRCRVAFPNRTPPARNNGTFYYLDVDGGNLIVTPPMNATVLEGERAELECLPKTGEWQVEWSKDGAPLDALPELAARALRPANGSLVLRAAAAADAGQYACTVRAPPHQQSAAAFLDVQYAARVVYAPEERFLALGRAASLDCHFSANPPLTNLRWEKDGFLFDPYNVPGVFYSRNGSLLFNQVDESHEGDYSCTPYNALGSAGPSPRVRVRVARPPLLATRPPPLLLARLGATAAMPCAPAPPPPGHPPAQLHWTREGGELPAGRHSLEGGNLTIVDVAEEDAGVYVCTATNPAGDHAARAELLVENAPPRAPHALHARPAPRSLHLSWRAPAPAGAPAADTDYTVWYRERGAGADWRTMRILTRGVTEATLVGLRPRTEYEVRVLAEDHIGDGLLSRPLHARTAGSDEEAEESEVEAEIAGETAYAAATTEAADEGEGERLEVSVRLLDDGALVRWQRAPHDESRCTVRWMRDDGDAPRLLAAQHTLHDYVLVRAVEEGARYRARVQCASGARGAAALRVPEYGRLRGVAAGAAGAALLLAALAGALLVARRRLGWRWRRGSAPRAPPPPPPPARDKRRR